MGELLYYMMVHYADVDVQDQARFYYSLLTGASGTKIQSVLKTMVYDASSVNQTISALLPGSIRGKRLSKITHLDDSIFTWESHLHHICVRHGQNKLISVTMQTVGKDGKLASCYETSLDKEAGTFQDYLTFLNQIDVVVNLTCRLKMTEQSQWSEVHALCVKVHHTQNYGSIPDNHITVLKSTDHVDVVLKIRPYLPVPQTFHASVTFTCSSKETFDVNLPTFSLDFSHLMMPLPWKPETSNTKEFFDELRQWLIKGVNSESFGIESLKLFDCSLDEFKARYSNKLGKFEVKDDKIDPLETSYVIFMPPKHHILLHCKDQKGKVVVSMVMDDWSLLPHIDKFLMEN